MSEQPTIVERAVQTYRRTLGDLADELGVSYESVQSYGAGRRRPSQEAMQSLADALEQHADDLARLSSEVQAEANPTADTQDDEQRSADEGDACPGCGAAISFASGLATCPACDRHVFRCDECGSPFFLDSTARPVCPACRS